VYGDAAEGVAALDAFLRDLPAGADSAPAAMSKTHLNGLSSRELEVLSLVAAGSSNHQIAEALVISMNTVARHVSNIFAKIGVANRTEAAGYFHRFH
jgi:DNA-binding NarL/FixJ family response regulator